MRVLLIVVAALVLACSSPKKLTVAAAADVQPALESLAKTRADVPTIIMGASGLLAMQLEQGAEYDVFVSADEVLVSGLVAKGLCDKASQHRYARGRLKLVSAPGHDVRDVSALESLKRVAIANPAHAPYGRAAMEALTRSGVATGSKLVLADNVRQALVFVDSGNAEAGLVASSLVPAERGVLVDAALHAPLNQSVAVCAKPERKKRAEAFVEALLSAEGQRVLTSFGFELP